MFLGARTRRLAAIAAVAVAGLIAAGCGGSSGKPPGASAKPVKGGTATVAILSGSFPNWIWPFSPITYYSVYNSQQFQWLMYRPLYVFGNNGESTGVNYPLSPANEPSYSDGGKTVTITMKGWKWSNGEAVDADDVAFWLNMMKAEKANYAGYSPGTLPDNLASFQVTSPNTIVLHLTQGYSPTWFTYNQLAEVTPMPQAWDVTKMGAKAGSGGCSKSVANCKKVFNFLNTQAKATSKYDSSPIWGVVDGPWKLKSFSNSGNDTFVPNKSYSGSPKPQLAAVKYVPYTDETAEFTALKANSVDVGTINDAIPYSDLPQKPANSALPATNPLGSGYNLQPFYGFGIYYYQINFKNPTYGPVFKQLYARQALQLVMDQPAMAKAIFRGYMVPGTGTVPAQPPSQWTPPVQKENGGAGPYPFSTARAKSLFTSHGWSQVGGVMTCQVPAKCGPGIKKGTQAKFTIDYTTGLPQLKQLVQVYKSDASKAGISISLAGKSFNTIIGQDTQKNPDWTISSYGGWLFNGPGFEPTGEPLFQTGAGSNSGSYSDPNMDKLIKQAQTGGLPAFHTYATYVAQQLPYIFQPNGYAIQPTKVGLKGVTYNPLWTFLPEYWYWTK